MRTVEAWPRLRQGIGKPLDSVEAVTGAAGGAGSIVGVGVGIFAGVIGIIASVAGVAVLDRANRLRAV